MLDWNDRIEENRAGSFSINLGEFGNRGLREVEFSNVNSKEDNGNTSVEEVSKETRSDETLDNEIVEISDDEDEIHEEPQLRRSTRIKTAPILV